jgi:hypothetical protein
MNFPTQKLRAIFFGEDWPRRWFGILGLIILFAALRWNNFDAPLTRDEGEYGYAAQLLEHGLAPYEHAFIQKPPMVFYSYALADFLLPHIFWAPRLLACAFVALATVLLGYIARLEFGKGFALPTMWLVTPMVLLPEIEQFTANTEMFMLLPLLATVVVYCHSRRHGYQPKHWFAAGFLGAVTLLYKYTTLPLLALVFVVWSVEMWHDAKDVRPVWRCWFSAFVGGLMASAAILGFFLVHDGGLRFWECTVLFNRYYTNLNLFGVAAFSSRLEGFWSVWWILFLVPWVVFIKAKPRIFFWLAMFVCATAATGASYYGHYYIIMMPFWALLATVGIHDLAAVVAQQLAQPSRWLASLLAAAVVVLVIRPDVPWLTCTRERFAEVKLGGWSPFLESPLVAKRIDELSSPRDLVYVAGSEPQILCYAGRFSPTRFVTTYPLMFPTPVAKIYQAEAIHDLEENPPALIVLVQSATSWPRQETTPLDFLVFLNRLLKQDYNLVGGYVGDGQAGHWSEPLADGEFANASLVIFKRKR